MMFREDHHYDHLEIIHGVSQLPLLLVLRNHGEPEEDMGYTSHNLKMRMIILIIGFLAPTVSDNLPHKRSSNGEGMNGWMFT